jgi:hypothetical protein
LAIGSIGSAASEAQSGSDLQPIAVRHSLLGVHRWYEQAFDGRPVIGSFYGRHEDLDGNVGVDP